MKTGQLRNYPEQTASETYARAHELREQATDARARSKYLCALARRQLLRLWPNEPHPHSIIRPDDSGRTDST